MSKALKPCPFCGGAAVRKPDPGEVNVPFGLVVDHKTGCFLAFAFLGTDEAVDAAWNARAAPAQAEASTLIEAVAQYVENWCYEPDGKSREHICCTATACDIANSIRRDGLATSPTTPAVESESADRGVEAAKRMAIAGKRIVSAIHASEGDDTEAVADFSAALADYQAAIDGETT